MDPRELPFNRARRHFLGAAAAVGARAAGIAAAAVAIASSPAQAGGRNWGRRGGGSHGGAGGSGGGSGGSGGSGGGSGSGGGGGASCLLRGTSILTPTGERRVEEVRIGDLVETASGEAKPIIWIGRQTFKKSRASWNESVMPIRISQDALDQGVPSRDLYVSPGHALYLDGVFFRAKDLVNESSIKPALPPGSEAIEYYNFLLDTHEVVVADGTPVETYQFGRNDYQKFDNFIELEQLHANDARASMACFAPVVGEESGSQHIKALLLLGVSRFVPVRDPFKDVSDRIAARAREMVN